MLGPPGVLVVLLVLGVVIAIFVHIVFIVVIVFVVFVVLGKGGKEAIEDSHTPVCLNWAVPHPVEHFRCKPGFS